MRTVTIRDLHRRTGAWVRQAAAGEAVVVSDRGRPVAILRPFEPDKVGQPLPDREKSIKRRRLIPVDSAVYVSDMRERG